MHYSISALLIMFSVLVVVQYEEISLRAYGGCLGTEDR